MQYFFRNSALVALTIAAVCGTRTEAQAAGSIRWGKSFESALAQARRTHKLVMVDFYTDWCGWCKRLDKDVYTDKRVVALSSQFVPVKVNAEKEGASAARRYNVTGFPTILFVGESGQVVNRIGGYLPPDQFYTAAANANSIYRGLARWEKAVRAHPNDETATSSLAMLYIMQGDANHALPMIARVEKLDPANRKGHLAKLCSGAGDRFQQNRHFPQAIEWFQKSARVGKTPL